jgi:hypothetical protein
MAKASNFFIVNLLDCGTGSGTLLRPARAPSTLRETCPIGCQGVYDTRNDHGNDFADSSAAAVAKRSHAPQHPVRERAGRTT